MKSMLLFIKKNRALLYLLMLSSTATWIWGGMLSGKLEAIPVIADGKTPVTIIMYHSILKEPNRSGDYVITPEQFENDIRYLIDQGYHFITVNDLIDFAKKRWSRLPEKSVMITFDDGFYNNYLYAYPIMKKYNACFVISVLGIYTDMNQEDEKMNPVYTHLTWAQLDEMDASGLVEIQNHSYNLHAHSKERIGSLKNEGETAEEYREALSEDIIKLQKLLKKNIGVVPNTFTYPFGRVSPESVGILKDLGFEAALTVNGGINYIGKRDDEALFHLKRFNRPHGKSSADFFKGKLE